MSRLSKIVNLFVYGTLKPGFHNYDNYLKGHTLSEVPAVLLGAKLYSLGSFPAIELVEDLSKPVLGYCISLPRGSRVLKWVDQLEGYYPNGQGTYDKKLVMVKCDRINKEQPAFVYHMNAEKLQQFGATPLDSYEWRKTISQRMLERKQQHSDP